MIQNMTSNAFLLGVNYWPRQKAMYWFSDFDADEVRREFEQIASFGLKMVRIFLLWEDWLPENENDISHQASRQLAQVLDIADQFKLKLNITFFTGHMSGPSWVAPWMLKSGENPSFVRQVVTLKGVSDQSYLNLYHDPQLRRAAKRIVEHVVRCFHQHPALGAWNLGNEPGFFSRPESSEAGLDWIQEFSETIKTIDSNHPTTCGIYMDALIENQGLRVDQIFKVLDLAVIHGYPMYADWIDDPLDSNYIPFLAALVQGLTQKPVLVEEFGGCTEALTKPSTIWKWQAYGKAREQFMASEEDFARYIDEVLTKLWQQGALGALIWSYADYHPSLWNKPPCDEAKHERFFGLVRSDGSVKKHADAIKNFSERNLERQSLKRFDLKMSADEYFQNPRQNIQDLYRSYKSLLWIG